MRTISGIGGMWLVAGRELRERGRSKSFIISCVVTLLLVGAALTIPGLVGGDAETHKIGVVGEDNQPIIDAAQDLAAADVDEGEQPDQFESVEFPSEEEAREALVAGEVDLVLTDGTRLLQERTGFSGNGLVDTLQRAAGSVGLQRLVEENGQAAADVIALLASSPLEVTSLTGDDPEGDIRPAIAYAGLLLMYIAILSYGSWTLTGVTEEKNNRVVEVLLATLRPWQLLGGKVLGIGLLAIGQFVLTIGFAFALVNLTGVLDQHTVTVRSDGKRFRPEPVTLEVAEGDLVVWHCPDATAVPFAVVGDKEFFGNIALVNECGFSHAFAAAGEYQWGDALGSDLKGVVRVTDPACGNAEDFRKWQRQLTKGTLVMIAGGKVDPVEVDIVTGQTVYFAVVKGKGISVTDVRLMGIDPFKTETKTATKKAAKPATKAGRKSGKKR